ncbi:MAG: cation diffusion facilitator family transporter [Euryarchaeota archaeon]|nr:cation diffusion facilitator family transporter [Euryarchaeota archaeon]
MTEHDHSKNALSEFVFEFRDVQKNKLVLSLSITAVVLVIELIGGILTNSIALFSDAGHMFTHAFALCIGLIALIIAKRPPCHHRTFGLYRAEILAAFVNGLFLLAIVGVIIYEAVLRMLHPENILGTEMLMVAFIGLAANIASIIILRGSHKHNLNIRGVFFHMIADAVSSVGIIAAALIILLTGWVFIDPLVSIGIAAIIVYWAWGILKESTRVLLEMAPKGLNIDIISDDLKKNFPEIKELYNAHIWSITPDILMFSAHVTLQTENISMKQEQIIQSLNKYLSEKYHIFDSTIQVTTGEDVGVCSPNVSQ